MVFRKYDENQDNQLDPDDDGNSLNTMYQNSKFKFLSNWKLGNYSAEQNAKKEAQLERARQARINELKVLGATREIIIYLVFLLVLFIVCYSNYGTNPYNYQEKIKRVFEPKVIYCLNSIYGLKF